MTIDAAASQQKRARRAAGQPLRIAHDRRVAGAFMTGLTQEGRPHFQQGGLRRAVRIMAVGAVLGDRLMLPQKRSPKFGMAAGASLRDGVPDELRRCGGPVRRVARSACHGAFSQGVMRGLEQIGVLCLVTSGADLDLSRRGLHRILGGVQSVAARAGDIARCVGAGGPVVCGIALVATQASRVLLRRRSQRLRPKINHAGQWSSTRPHMRAAGAVAGLALQTAVTERTLGVIGPRMGGAENAGDSGVVVAAETGIGPLRTVDGVDVRRSIGRPRVCAQAQQQGGAEQRGSARDRPGSRQPRHSVRRGGDVMYDFHICDSAGAVAHTAGLHIRRGGAQDRAAFRVLADRR